MIPGAVPAVSTILAVNAVYRFPVSAPVVMEADPLPPHGPETARHIQPSSAVSTDGKACKRGADDCGGYHVSPPGISSAMRAISSSLHSGQYVTAMCRQIPANHSRNSDSSIDSNDSDSGMRWTMRLPPIL